MVRLLIFALTTLGTALGLENADPNAWFSDTAVLALVVAAIIAALRKGITLDGIAVVIASVVVGAGLGGIGFAAGLFAVGSTVANAVIFGATAGWLASGGVDLLRGVLPKSPEA